MLLEIDNDGPEIVSTNFWETEMASRGMFFVSTNAGAFRILVPDSIKSQIPEMRKGAKHFVVSCLPSDQWTLGSYSVEVLIEDRSDNPYVFHLDSGGIDRGIGPDSVGIEWKASVWENRGGKPHRVFERPAFVQVVPSIPWMKSIER